MIPVTVDTLDLSSEFNLTRQDVDNLLEYTVKEVTKQFARVWEGEAKKTLKKSRSDYIKSIRIDSKGRFTGIAYLDPITWLVNAVEMGAESFDIKAGLLSSPKAKQGKKGRYITVPFRFATAGSIGDSSIFAGVMPDNIQKAVEKREKQTPSSPGLKLSDIPAQHQMPKSASLRQQLKSEGFDSLKANTQMTSKYEGLKRSNIGSGYVTFRRVGEASEGWQHPGIQERNLVDKALSIFEGRIPEIVDLSIENFLVSLGF